MIKSGALERLWTCLQSCDIPTRPAVCTEFNGASVRVPSKSLIYRNQRLQSKLLVGRKGGGQVLAHTRNTVQYTLFRSGLATSR